MRLIQIYACILALSSCLIQCSFQQARNGNNDLSDYFRAKHVINDGHVRRQLQSSNIPDTRKQQILQNYIGKSFNAQPNLPAPGGRQPWRAQLGGRSSTTYILANQKQISDAVRQGVPDGFDSNGAPVMKTKQNFQTMKVKTTFLSPNSGGSGPKQNIHTKFVNDGLPTIRREPLRVSHNSNGNIHHFESANKRIPPPGNTRPSVRGRGKG